VSFIFKKPTRDPPKIKKKTPPPPLRPTYAYQAIETKARS
jgi:hypothetical protein